MSSETPSRRIAALTAACLEPASLEWMQAGHRSAEAGHRAALALHRNMATFAEAGVSERSVPA